MATYLDGIVAWHRARAAADGRDVERLTEEAKAAGGAGMAGASRGFSAQLRRFALGNAGDTGNTGDTGDTGNAGDLGDTGNAGGSGNAGDTGSEAALDGRRVPAVIAELKRRSPSKGDLAIDLDPAIVAAEYARGGAACLSVLTDQQFFGGSVQDLVAARMATNLPVLRKDFTVSEVDVCDARIMGADCVLLIVAALCDDMLVRLVRLAASVGIDALVEVHDEAEATRALDAGASLIGVNQRDLTTFEVDPVRAERVAEHLPASVLKVAESGISSPEDAERLGRAGYDALLVGEALVRSADRAEAVRRLRGLGESVAAPAGADGTPPGADETALGSGRPSR